MNNPIAKNEAYRPEHDLQVILQDLVQFGEPRMYYSNGWMCKVDMNTNAKGASFDIRSDFSHKSAVDAVLECRERIDKALETLR